MEKPIKIVEAAPDEGVRGEGFLRALERPFLALDRWIQRWIPPSLNPFGQTGAIANVSFLVAVVSGVLLLFWYVPSVSRAWNSLENLDFFGQFIRSLHRYSSDATVFFVAIHALKLFFGRRFGGPRWVAWVTGFVLLGLLWFVGWLGYWLVWDVRAQAVAVETARFVEVLPIFTDPLSRTFLTDDGVSTPLFFTVFFFHMLIPLAMGIALWMHISRVARARFLTSRALTAWVIGAMVVASVAFPATSAAPAEMTAALGEFTMDWWYLAPLVITERLSTGALWGLTLFASIIFFSIPWTLTRKRAQTAVVDLKRCNGCSNCANDCPYSAIVMVPRTDDHKRYEQQAQVDPNRCVGCGICAGSCNPGGIGLPQMPVQDKRKIVDQWIDETTEEGDEAFVAFLCANSAAGSYVVREDGTCEELPGYRVVGVPCSGWVHPLSVERALRRGAEGVVIVGCGCSDPPFREGVKWTDERLSARREPQFRLEKVDPDRVRFMKHPPGDDRAARQDLEAFREHTTERDDTSTGRAKMILGGILVSAAVTAIVVLGSDLPSLLPVNDTPQLVVSLEHRPDSVERCRPPTAEEKANTPVHMQTDEICERRRPDARLEVLVDSEVVHSRQYDAHGLADDGPSFGVARVPVEPGAHRVQLRVGDTAHDGWTDTFDRELELEPGRRLVVEFETDRGFEVTK